MAAKSALPIASGRIELRESDLRRMFPKARTDYVQALMAGIPLLEKYGILANSKRWCAFIANVGCETGGLTIVRENMNYTAKNLLAVWPSRYPNTVAGRALAKSHAAKGPKFIANYNYGNRLGNRGRNTDDGWNYRGALLLQHTGRAMALWLQEKTGLPWADKPELFNDVSLCVEPACLVWTSQDLGNLNDWADRGLFRACCNGINRGNPRSSLNPIGWDQRQEWHRKALAIWGGEALPENNPSILRVGSRGEIVKHYQTVLHNLGYHQVGKIDGIYGDNTAAAVLDFQRVNNLKVDGIIGPETRAALDGNNALPRPISDERADATVADVVARVPSAQKANFGRRMSQFFAGFSFLGALKWFAEQIQSVREIIEPISGHLSWLADYWWAFGILFAFILIDSYGSVLKGIWRDFRAGRLT